MSHEAIVERREDPERAVVVHADPVIWIHPDLLAEAAPPGEAQITGGLERDGAVHHPRPRHRSSPMPAAEHTTSQPSASGRTSEGPQP